VGFVRAVHAAHMARTSWWRLLAASFVTEIPQQDGSTLLVPHTMLGCTDLCPPIHIPAPADVEPLAVH